MGKSKSKKAKAAVDEPGPDDFTFLAVYFPVGRRGAPLARESSSEDQKAAHTIGMWMNHIGLPIRKLFARKSEEHVIVEVREEISQEVIDSKLGAYRWGDVIYAISARDADSETVIMRAKVRSHDGVDKMGGMVYFPIARMLPTGPRGDSPFKEVVPPPRKSGFTEHSKFSAIKSIPLPPEPLIIQNEDVKPNVFSQEGEVKPDIKPDIKPDVSQDLKPRLADEESKPTISETDLILPNIGMNTGLVKEEVKPSVIKDEDQKPSLTSGRPIVDMNPELRNNVPIIEMNPELDNAVEEKKPIVEPSGSPDPVDSSRLPTVSPESQQEPSRDPPPTPKEEVVHQPLLSKRPAEEQGSREGGVKRERRED